MLEHVKGRERSLALSRPISSTKGREEYMQVSVSLQSFKVDPVELRDICKGVLAQYMTGFCDTEKQTSKSACYVC
jgi:hypothetical protein